LDSLSFPKAKAKQLNQSSNPPAKKNGKKPRLSAEERAKLRAEGKCYTCKRDGHFARDCPDREGGKPKQQQQGFPQQ
jgi:hypothetical protein